MKRDDPMDVLIAGGGVAALEAMLTLRALAEERVRVELLAPEHHFFYRPLAVAEPFELGRVERFDLAELAASAGAVFSPGALVSVDAGRRVVHTSAGAALSYDALLIACGVSPEPAVPGALTFRGPADVEAVRQLLDDVEAGHVRRLVFAQPWGAVWSLPIYELALMAAAWITARGIDGVDVSLLTVEDEPLRLFGPGASRAVCALLDERGITLHVRTRPREVVGGELRLFPEGVIAADRVVTLPRLRGRRVDGVPQTSDGFISVDPHGRVIGLSDIYAAGDITNFPVKQGGIAAQQADAAAEAIAAAAGAGVDPRPFRPVLRGLLLTGGEPRYLRRDLATSPMSSTASPEPLWWPPAKIVGRYLAPFLGSLAGAGVAFEPPERGVPVEVELTDADLERAAARPPDPVVEHTDDDAPKVGDVVSEEPLVVAPEDTLGEVAERMRARDVGSALVVDYGRLIGILTARDLLRAVAGRVHPSEARVREWMTADPLMVSSDALLEAAALLMVEHGIHHLPVVEVERPVGMIGLCDATRPAIRVRSGIGLGF